MRIKESRKGIIFDSEMKKPSIKILYVCIYLVALIVSLICLLPTLWIILSAFKDTEEFFRIPPTIIPQSFDAEKIVRIWNEGSFGSSFFSTIVMTVGCVVFSLLSNGIAGFVLSRLKPKGSTMLMTLILWTIMFPTTLNQVPLFMTFLDMPLIHTNMVNSYMPFWMMAGANAFHILLFKNSFDSISISIIEAAKIDGCHTLKIFTHIVIPMSRPIIMTVLIFTVNANWGAFYWPFLLLKDPDMYTVGLTLYRLKTMVTMDEYMVALIFIILPPSLVFIFFHKHIMGGVNVGGVKG